MKHISDTALWFMYITALELDGLAPVDLEIEMNTRGLFDETAAD